MANTHDHNTKLIKVSELNSTHVLVGESGGLSAVYDVEPSSTMPGLLRTETEHGSLYLDPEETQEVLDETGPSAPVVAEVEVEGVQHVLLRVITMNDADPPGEWDWSTLCDMHRPDAIRVEWAGPFGDYVEE